MRTAKIYCPVNGWDCPYYKDGECGLENPHADCDDFANMYDDDDYYCEDEERTFFADQYQKGISFQIFPFFF